MAAKKPHWSDGLCDLIDELDSATRWTKSPYKQRLLRLLLAELDGARSLFETALNAARRQPDQGYPSDLFRVLGDAWEAPEFVVGWEAKIHVAFPQLLESVVHKGWDRLVKTAGADLGSQATFTVYTEATQGSDEVVAALEAFAQELGYGDISLIGDETGSRWRRWGSKARTVVDSDVVQKGAHALELAAIGVRQAEITEALARAARDVVSSLADHDYGVARAGQLLAVKFERNGKSVLLIRTLSVAEMLVLEKFPEIEKVPERVFDALAVALTLDPETATVDQILPPPRSEEAG